MDSYIKHFFSQLYESLTAAGITFIENNGRPEALFRFTWFLIWDGIQRDFKRDPCVYMRWYYTYNYTRSEHIRITEGTFFASLHFAKFRESGISLWKSAENSGNFSCKCRPDIRAECCTLRGIGSSVSPFLSFFLVMELCIHVRVHVCT